MTLSGERSALDPDLVPVHQRLRGLLELHIEGPILVAECQSVRESLAWQRPHASDMESNRPADARPGFEAFKLQRRTEQSTLVETLRAAGAASAQDFTRLSEQLRSMEFRYRRVPNIEASDIDLPLERTRALALHLLNQGTSASELQIGLYLILATACDEDAVLLRALALLGRDFSYAACKALRRLTTPAVHLYWVLCRVGTADGEPYVAAIAELSDEEFGALLDGLSVAQAAALVQRFTVMSRTLPRFDGHRRLAEAVLAAARAPSVLGDFPESHMLIAQLWDAVRFGRTSLLGFEPGEREEVAEKLRAVLTAPESVAAAERNQGPIPHDPDLIWLRRQINSATESESSDLPPGLAIRFTVPTPSSREDVRPHFLVDGVPLVEQLYDRGYADSPERLLQRGMGLRASPEARDVRLAEGYCVEECCGALRAEIHRDESAGLVIWDVRDTGKPRRDPIRFTFEADAYDAEIARAEADFRWEWPARRAARLLRNRIVREPELLSRWQCKLLWVSSWNGSRSTLRLFFSYPDLQSVEKGRWLQFEYTAEVPDTAAVEDASVAAAVERISSMLRTTDAKSIARVCGGSRDDAEALGYPWPA
jgi:hypothetical protein